jgi:hypothetical protein
MESFLAILKCVKNWAGKENSVMAMMQAEEEFGQY